MKKNIFIKLSNKRTLLYLFLCLSLFTVHCTLSTDVFAGTAGKVRSGNSAYKKGNYEKSLQKYRDAEISDPDNPVVHYNSGNALNKIGELEESDKEYNRALSSGDPRIKSKIYYNLGNNAVMNNDLDKALEHYKKALDIDPNDEDAKFNYESVKAFKANPQQNKSKPKDGKGKQDKDKEGKEKGKGDKDKNKQGQSKEDKNKMSKEDAQRILQYFDDTDKNSAKKRKMAIPNLPKVEEDW